MKQHIKTHRMELLADTKPGHNLISEEGDMLVTTKNSNCNFRKRE